jgi:hypothetical protein
MREEYSFINQLDSSVTNYATGSDDMISNALVLKTGTNVISHHKLLLIELHRT